MTNQLNSVECGAFNWKSKKDPLRCGNIKSFYYKDCTGTLNHIIIREPLSFIFLFGILIGQNSLCQTCSKEVISTKVYCSKGQGKTRESFKNFKEVVKQHVEQRLKNNCLWGIGRPGGFMCLSHAFNATCWCALGCWAETYLEVVIYLTNTVFWIFY